MDLSIRKTITLHGAGTVFIQIGARASSKKGKKFSRRGIDDLLFSHAPCTVPRAETVCALLSFVMPLYLRDGVPMTD